MAYQPHTLVTIGGTLTEQTGQDEIWQIGMRGFGPGQAPVNADDLQHLAEVVLNGPTGTGAGVSSLWRDGRGKISQEAFLVWCKAANIGPDGKYTSSPGVAQQTPLQGASAKLVPGFCSVAISWTTGLTLGRGIRGRVYLPNTGATPAAGSTVAATDVAGIAAWAKDLLSKFDTSGDLEAGVPSFVPWIVSKLGPAHPITGGRVGNIWDTQRRRKDKHPETYTPFTK